MSRDPDLIMAQADGLRARVGACWCSNSTVLQLCDKCEATQDTIDDLEAEYEAARAALEEESGVCPSCNGSGEGYCDGARCSSCGGSGAARGGSDDDDAPYELYLTHTEAP